MAFYGCFGFSVKKEVCVVRSKILFVRVRRMRLYGSVDRCSLCLVKYKFI